MTWSPLACGIVSGKYDSGIPPYSRASLKVNWRRGLGEGIGRDRHFGGMEPLGGHLGAGHLPWATVCGAVPGVGTWSPSWPDPMSRKAAHLWDIRQLKLPPPHPGPRPKFNTHNPGQGYGSISGASSPIDTPTFSGPPLNLWVEGCVISSVSLRSAPGKSEHPTHTPQSGDSEGLQTEVLGGQGAGRERPDQSRTERTLEPPALGIRMACLPHFSPNHRSLPEGSLTLLWAHLLGRPASQKKGRSVCPPPCPSSRAQS